MRRKTGIGWIEMPQRSSLPPYRGVLSCLSKAREASGSEAARVHHAARLRGGAAAWRSHCTRNKRPRCQANDAARDYVRLAIRAEAQASLLQSNDAFSAAAPPIGLR